MTFLTNFFHYPKRVIRGGVSEGVDGCLDGEFRIPQKFARDWVGTERGLVPEGSASRFADLANQFGMGAWVKLPGKIISGLSMA